MTTLNVISLFFSSIWVSSAFCLLRYRRTSGEFFFFGSSFSFSKKSLNVSKTKRKATPNKRRSLPLQRRRRRPVANIRNKLLRADHFTSYVGADMHQSANLAAQREPKPERALGAKPARPLLTHRSMRRLSRAVHGVFPFTQKTGRRGGNKPGVREGNGNYRRG